MVFLPKSPCYWHEERVYLWTMWGSTWHSLDGCYFTSCQKRCGVLASISALCSTSKGKVWKISWILHHRYSCSYLYTKWMCSWLGVCFCCTRFKESVHFSQKDTITPEKIWCIFSWICRTFGFVGMQCYIPSWFDSILGLQAGNALASASPVCGLLHPSEKAINLLTKMKTTCISHSPTDMECLQQEFPVLFELIQSKTFPQRLLSPIMEDLIEKSTAPFKTEVKADMSLSETSTAQELSFFLP